MKRYHERYEYGHRHNWDHECVEHKLPPDSESQGLATPIDQPLQWPEATDDEEELHHA